MPYGKNAAIVLPAICFAAICYKLLGVLLIQNNIKIGNFFNNNNANVSTQAAALRTATTGKTDGMKNSKCEKWKQDRIKLSRMMNKISQKKAILTCEMEKSKQAHYAILKSGGWCEKTIDPAYDKHVTDGKLVDELALFYTGKKVGSFGDGRGHYKTAIDKTGKVTSYDAYDGGPYYDVISKGGVKYLDLTLPQYGLPLYDWAMSLEVAEHIPREFEAVYLDNIIRHAKEGIVLSWAVPSQIGLGHVNGRPLDYVITTLKNSNFIHDPEASKLLQSKASVSWLQKNINVFKRSATSTVDLDEL